MKHKIINPNSNFALESPDKKRNDKMLQPHEEIGKLNIYWYAYAYSSPFMPMIDATFALDELKKLVKKWLSRKNLAFKKNS